MIHLYVQILLCLTNQEASMHLDFQECVFEVNLRAKKHNGQILDNFLFSIQKFFDCVDDFLLQELNQRTLFLFSICHNLRLVICDTILLKMLLEQNDAKKSK